MLLCIQLCARVAIHKSMEKFGTEEGIYANDDFILNSIKEREKERIKTTCLAES